MKIYHWYLALEDMGVHCFAHILFYDLSNVALNSERGIRYTAVEFFPDIFNLLLSC